MGQHCPPLRVTSVRSSQSLCRSSRQRSSRLTSSRPCRQSTLPRPYRDLSNNHSHNNNNRLCSRCWGILRISKPTSNRLRGVFRIGQHLHQLLTFVVRTDLLLWHRRQMTKVRCLGMRRFKRRKTSDSGVETLRSGQLRRLRTPSNGTAAPASFSSVW